MQPYFMPYIGYFQLINSVDEFVVYDNIEFTKKGWINRNRILVNGTDHVITLPLKKDSDYLNINGRKLSSTWINDKRKMLNKIRESYRKAPYFEIVFQIVEGCILIEEDNLFNFIYNSLEKICEYLAINTKFRISSNVGVDPSLKAEKKVIEICKLLKATNYINPIGGLELYSKDEFKNEGIELKFLKSSDLSYKQFDVNFVPWLSIIDVMMFNSKEEIGNLLQLKSLI